MKSLIEIFQNLIELYQLRSRKILTINDKLEETKIEPYEWLVQNMKSSSTDVERCNSSILSSGKIYIFNYSAAYPDRYAYWDAHPIIISLGRRRTLRGEVNLGINITWYPPKIRKFMIDKIRSFYSIEYKSATNKNPNQSIKQKSINLDVDKLKLALDSYGFSFAIRSYLDSGISSVYCVSYENWNIIADIDNPFHFPDLQGKTSISSIYKEFERHLTTRKNKKR